MMGRPFRVKKAYGVYRVGEIIYPTGVLRSDLLAADLIEPVIGVPVVERAVAPPMDRKRSRKQHENTG